MTDRKLDDTNRYVVFKGDHRLNPIRLGMVLGQRRAIDLMERMYARLPGDYFILDLSKDEVIASLPGTQNASNS